VNGRKLTDRVIDICRSLFGDAINYSQVQVFNQKWWPFQPRNITMAPDGNLWFHPDSGLFCDSFCGSSAIMRGHFVHEMVHVWQHQSGIFLPLARHPFCRYDYKLVPGKNFASYGIEQQAEIVSHIYLLKQGLKLKNRYILKQYDGLLPFEIKKALVTG